MSTGRPTACDITEYLLRSNWTRQVLLTDAARAWNPSNGPLWRTKCGRSASNMSPHCAVLTFRVRQAAGMGDALLQQPGIQFGAGRKARPWLEQPLAQNIRLVLDLAFLPTRRRCAGGRFNRIMTAHLQKAPVEGSCPSTWWNIGWVEAAADHAATVENLGGELPPSTAA